MVLKYHVVALPALLSCLTQDKIFATASKTLSGLALPALQPLFLWLSRVPWAIAALADFSVL